MKASCAWSRWRVATTCAVLFAASGTVRSARMWFPKSAGMDEVSPQLYVEPAMTTEQQQDVQRKIVLGRAQVEPLGSSVCALRSDRIRSSSHALRAAPVRRSRIRDRPRSRARRGRSQGANPVRTESGILLHEAIPFA